MAKKLIALLLAALMICTCMLLTACKGEEGSETTAGGTDKPGGDDGEYPNLEVLPENFKYDGTITFLTMGSGYNTDDWQTRDIYAEKESDDPIETAVFRRNQWLKDQYGIEIKEINTATPYITAQAAVSSNSNEYQVFMVDTLSTVNLMLGNMLLDLNEEDSYLDFSQPWWDSKMAESCSIRDHIYFATGDIQIMDDDATWVLMFNKQMITRYDLENPYELVANNEWTYDKMYEMMRVVAGEGRGDTNANDQVDAEIDTFGWSTHMSSRYALFYASGERVAIKDDTDTPMINEASKGRVQQVLEKSLQLWDDRALTFACDRSGYTSNTTQEIFQSGRALFLGEVMQLVQRLRDMEIDFGVIPYPKFTSDQEGYGNYVHAQSALLSIPKNCPNFSDLTCALELMAFKSQSTLTPAYYEITLVGKFFRDEESSPMLDIIMNSKIYDLGSENMCNWGAVGAVFPKLLAEGKTNYSSSFARSLGAAKSQIKSTLKKIG